MNVYLDIILRTIAVYAFVFIAIRITDKKEVSQLSIIDFVMILLVSNSVQNSMVGPDNSLTGGLVAAGVLFVIDYIIKTITWKSKKARKLVEGEPVILIYKGEVMKKNLKSERMSVDEMLTTIRSHGLSKFEQVDLAILETNGSISVIPMQKQEQEQQD